MFRNVLVNIDGSAASRAALRHAIDLACAGAGRIGLLAPAPRASMWLSGLYALPVSRSQMDEHLVAAAQRNVDAAAGGVPAEVPVTKLVIRDKAVQALLTQLCEGQWDVVIVGGQLSMSPWPSFGLACLVKSSPVPVVIVQPRRERADLG